MSEEYKPYEEWWEREGWSFPMIKVLCLSLWYPLSMSRYFEKAFRHHPKVDFRSAGVFTGSWIPWMGGMNLPEKYATPPDYPLPFRPDVGRVSYSLVKAQLGDWVPDIVVAIDAGINWVDRPSDGYAVTIGTDPHVLDYSHARKISDKFFNMQLTYSEPKDIYLPYAYSQYDFYPCDTPTGKKDLDAVLIGMPYPQRIQWIEELKRHGVNAYMENGPVFDEARELYSRTNIGLNWSSMNDLNCRVFELPAMRLYPIVNNVPDLWQHEYLHHHVIFNNLGEAVDAVLWAKNNPEKARWNAEEAYELIQGQTYDARVNQLLKECGYE